MNGRVVAGILGIVAISIAPIVVFCLLDRAALLLRGRGRTVRMTRRDVPTPVSRPIESIARDVRRLARETRSPAVGVSQLRRDSIWAAYDDVLAECCACLQVPCRLTEIPVGPDRDRERARVEQLLHQAGMVLDNAA